MDTPMQRTQEDKKISIALLTECGAAVSEAVEVLKTSIDAGRKPVLILVRQITG